jgi:hypothetical protein
MVPPELPCSGRWAPESRGHVAPLALPCAGRWALEPRGHVAPLALPCAGRWALEPPLELPRAEWRAPAPRGHMVPPDPPPSPEVGAGATRTRGSPGAALRREVSAGAAISRGVGAGGTGTRGTPRATLSWEPGTTPPPPSTPYRAWLGRGGTYHTPR